MSQGVKPTGSKIRKITKEIVLSREWKVVIYIDLNATGVLHLNCPEGHPHSRSSLAFFIIDGIPVDQMISVCKECGAQFPERFKKIAKIYPKISKI